MRIILRTPLSLGTLLLAGLFIGLLAGCAPELGSRLELGMIPAIAPIKSRDFEMVKLHVMKFQDSRTNDTIADVAGKEMRAGSDVGSVVQEAFENAIRINGGRLCAFDCASVTGEILRWKITAQQAFPMSTYDAEASIRISILNAKGDAVFTGNYSGSTQTKHPLLTEEKVHEVLTQSMGYAIDEAVRDRRVVEKLNELS